MKLVDVFLVLVCPQLKRFDAPLGFCITCQQGTMYDHATQESMCHLTSKCPTRLVDVNPPISHNVNIQSRFVKRRLRFIARAWARCTP